MEQLRLVLQEAENILLNPYKVFTNKNGSKEFDAATLKKSFRDKLPEGFEIGLFTTSNGENIPAFLPFAETNGIAFSIEKTSDFAFFNEMLECSIFQILNAIEHDNFKLTLIDGKNHGIYFNYLSQFDDMVTGGKVFKEPSEITKILTEIILQSSREHRFIVINNFPHGFTNESATVLIKILNNAPKQNIKVLMTKEMDPSRAMADLDTSISSKLELIYFDRNGHWGSTTLSQIENINESFTLNFGSPYDEKDMKTTVEVINEKHQKNVNSISEEFDINKGIKIPFGLYHNKTFYFRLGHGVTNFHAIVAGRSGKGKTVFLDNIILRATTIYSPDELRFVLLDMKGVEFSDYKDLPHTQAFCSSTNFEDAIKIVEFLQGELKNREALFNVFQAKNIVEYKTKSGMTLPRLLVIIDEFQNLFTGNYKTDGFIEDVLIKQILRIGRAYGIHLICCTQSLGDGVRSSFLNNIPLRIAFQMTQDQSRSFLSMNNSAADILKVGEVIYNEQDGLLNENIKVNVDNMESDDIQKYILTYNTQGKPYQIFERLVIAK